MKMRGFILKTILTISSGLILMTGVVLAQTTSNDTSFSKGKSVPPKSVVVSVKSNNVNPGSVAGGKSSAAGRQYHQRSTSPSRALNINGIGTVDASRPSPKPTETDSDRQAEYSGIPSRP
jgi:hypothetical protein